MLRRSASPAPSGSSTPHGKVVKSRTPSVDASPVRSGSATPVEPNLLRLNMSEKQLVSHYFGKISAAIKYQPNLVEKYHIVKAQKVVLQRADQVDSAGGPVVIYSTPDSTAGAVRDLLMTLHFTCNWDLDVFSDLLKDGMIPEDIIAQHVRTGTPATYVPVPAIKLSQLGNYVLIFSE